ncbi:MAG: hypothetical protein IPG70_08295 [Moraxellaceae bacterium]|nr:hypothetical protein [Moraxellaceae bacterium]
MHTTQDFFAHATWVETNAHYKAFDKNKNLNPLSATKLPYPKFGKTANPFGEDFRAGTGVIILDDNPNNTNNDDKEGGCSEKSYNAGVGQLTTAYYDYAMSSLLLHAEVDKGYSTSAWNGIKISKLRSEVPPYLSMKLGRKNRLA